MNHFLRNVIIGLLLVVFAIPTMGAASDNSDLKESLQALDSTIQLIKTQYDKLDKSKKQLAGTNAATALEPMDHIYNLATSLELVSHDLKQTAEDFEASSNQNSPSVGHGKIKISAYAQQQYYEEFGDNNESDFISKRARFIIKGNINRYAKLKLQTDFAGSPRLLDAALTLSPNKSWSLTAGQFKPPFGTDFLKSSSALPFVNRFSANKLGTGRDIGAMITFQQNLNSNMSMKVSSGLFNGAGINQSDINNDKNFVGRAELHYKKNMIITAHVISGKTNEVDSVKAQVDLLGASFTTQWNNNIIEAEFVYSEVDQTKATGWNTWAGHTFNTNAAFIPAVQLLARYEQYDVNTGVTGDRTDRITLGTNLYVDNKYTKLQFNYQINNEEVSTVDNNEFLVSLQVAF